MQAQAARTIVGRGVRLIATVHGKSLANVINDPERSLLLGGITKVTLSVCEISIYGSHADFSSLGIKRVKTPLI